MTVAACGHDEAFGLEPERGRSTVPDALLGPVGVHVLDRAAIDHEVDGIDLETVVRRSGERHGLDLDQTRAHLALVFGPVVVAAVNIHVQRSGPTSGLADRFWVGDAGATHGEGQPCGCWTLSAMASPYVPVAAAERAGIGPGLALDGDAISLSDADLDALGAALASGTPVTAARVLEARGVERDVARTAVTIASRARARVVVSATWADGSGVSTRHVEHLTTGDARWRVESDDVGKTFVPLGPTAAFADVAGLLPGADDLRLPTPWGVVAG